MKKDNVKNIVKNCIKIFIIFFMFLFIITLKQDYDYYDMNEHGGLTNFLSMKKIIWDRLYTSLWFGIWPMIISLPIFIFLEKKDIKNSKKFLIALGIILIIGITYFFMNFHIPF